MPGSILTLQVGQCGNQIGQELWARLIQEHGINQEGIIQPEAAKGNGGDRKDVFFYQADDDHYIPRALMIDLEPGVIKRLQTGQYKKLYNPENIFIDKEESGAGNNWGVGYMKGRKCNEQLMEMIDREADNCDSLEAFTFLHSIAGGTGSGVGSHLLEALSDRYPKKILQTYSVFPHNNDVVVQSYNSILTLKRLALNADTVTVLDNVALDQIASQLAHSNTNLQPENENKRKENETNSLVAKAIAASTSTLRFPEYMNNSLSSLMSSLIPTPRLHFLMCGFTPLTVDRVSQSNVQKTSVLDVMKRLIHPNNMMVSSSPKTGKYISLLNIIQGEVEPSQVYQALHRLRARRQVKFIDWGPASIQVALSKKSPFIESSHRVSGLALANNTNIHTLMSKFVSNFDRIYAKRAYINHFETVFDSPEDLDAEFQSSRNVVQDLIEEYKAAEDKSYPNFSLEHAYHS